MSLIPVNELVNTIGKEVTQTGWFTQCTAVQGTDDLVTLLPNGRSIWFQDVTGRVFSIEGDNNNGFTHYLLVEQDDKPSMYLAYDEKCVTILD